MIFSTVLVIYIGFLDLFDTRFYVFLHEDVFGTFEL